MFSFVRCTFWAAKCIAQNGLAKVMNASSCCSSQLFILLCDQTVCFARAHIPCAWIDRGPLVISSVPLTNLQAAAVTRSYNTKPLLCFLPKTNKKNNTDANLAIQSETSRKNHVPAVVMLRVSLSTQCLVPNILRYLGQNTVSGRRNETLSRGLEAVLVHLHAD